MSGVVVVTGGGGSIAAPFAAVRARGHNLYLPIPFARRCKITLDGDPENRVYYVINYRKYNESAAVGSFSSADLQAAQPLLGETQATPISITHYQDRDGNFLADVSPRRYFCEQCHVVQMDGVDPVVKNRFRDVEAIIRGSKPADHGRHDDTCMHHRDVETRQ